MPGRLNKALQAIATGGVAALAVLALELTGVTERFELVSWDWRARVLAAPGPATDDIRVILLDQSSLDWAREVNALGWPWPRQAWVPLLDFLQQAGARAVILDVLFSEDSTYGVADDEHLAQALSQGVPVAGALMLAQGTARELDGVVSSQLVDWPGRPPRLPALVSERVTPPVSPLREAMERLGSVYERPDADSVFRRVAPVRFIGETPVPTLGLAGYLAAGGEAGVLETMPLDDGGRAILRYAGELDVYQPVNAAAVIQSGLRLREGDTPVVSPEHFRDKYVFLAFSAPGLHDLGPTPLSPAAPRVSVHVAFLDNLLGETFMRPVPAGGWVVWLFALALVTALTVRVLQRPGWIAMVALPLLALPVLAGFTAYQAGWWLPVASPLLATGLALVFTLGLNYALEGRQRRFIRQAFQHYLSPTVIRALVEDPERLQLGGETRELTLFFSDVADFTGISEALDPQALTALLNEYLSAMTDIILEEGGTIDKYEGDAIIAFWNAPLPQPDHAERGVRAAIRCQEALAAMRADLQRCYGQPLFARIGLNSGSVVVGNMGSRQRFDYTFLGDAGNLAARLEGVNKVFGTHILISEHTQRQLPTTWPVREVGQVQVVGRQTSVTVYEPLTGPQRQQLAPHLPTFERALRYYYDGEVASAGEIFQTLAGDDPVAAAYLQRCQDALAGAAVDAAEWDPVWHLSSK